MSPTPILVFSPRSAQRCREILAPRDLDLRVAPTPAPAPAPDARAWQRAVSELALFNWLVVASAPAAEALFEAIGAPPGPTLRVAALSAAAEVFRQAGREPEVEADELRALLAGLAGSLGRRQRVFVPHAAGAGRRVAGWLEELGAEAVLAAAYDLRVPEGFAPPNPAVAVLWESADAERLIAWSRAGSVPATIPVAALGRPAMDAAEDCGLNAVAIHDADLHSRLGPFLDEALS